MYRYHNLACVLRDTGEYALSEEYFLQARAIWEKPNESGRTPAVNNLVEYAKLPRRMRRSAERVFGH